MTIPTVTHHIHRFTPIDSYLYHNSLSTYKQWVFLGGVMVTVLATLPKVRGFKPDWGRWIFKGEIIRSKTSFRGEVKPPEPCFKILRHVKDPLRFDSHSYRQNTRTFLAKLLAASLLGICIIATELWWTNQELLEIIWGRTAHQKWSRWKGQGTLVNESGMIRTQMRSTTNHKMVTVAWGALYDTIL
jgi:hypothetical protein